VTGQDVQGMGGGGLHASGGEPVDDPSLVLHRHLGGGKDDRRLGHLGQHLTGEHGQFADHLATATDGLGRVDDRLRVDLRHPVGGDVDVRMDGAGRVS